MSSESRTVYQLFDMSDSAHGNSDNHSFYFVQSDCDVTSTRILDLDRKDDDGTRTSTNHIITSKIETRYKTVFPIWSKFVFENKKKITSLSCN